jgi:hypothetical protein
MTQTEHLETRRLCAKVEDAIAKLDLRKDFHIDRAARTDDSNYTVDS